MVDYQESSLLLLGIVEHTKRVLDYCDFYSVEDNRRLLNKQGKALKPIRSFLCPGVEFKLKHELEFEEDMKMKICLRNYVSMKLGRNNNFDEKGLARLVHRRTSLALNDLWDISKHALDVKVYGSGGILSLFYLTFISKKRAKGFENEWIELVKKGASITSYKHMENPEFMELFGINAESLDNILKTDYSKELFG